MAAATARTAARRAVPHYSAELRSGIADSVAMLASRPDTDPAWDIARKAADAVVRAVTEILGRDADGDVWAAVGAQLPLLAEASPWAILQALEAGVGEDGVIASIVADDDRRKLFDEQGALHGIIAALEVLAWRPDLLARVTDVLGSLARLIPPTEKRNAPLEALTEMFLPWLPQTGGRAVDRFEAIDVKLRRRDPNLSWSLLVRLLPQQMGTSGYTRAPRWRDWRPDRDSFGVTIAEYRETAERVVERAIEDAGVDGTRWAQLVEAYSRLPPASRKEVLERLQTMDVEQLDEAGREAIRRELRHEVGRHHAFSTARWTLPAAEVDELEAVAPRFEPHTLTARYGWLFVDYVEPYAVGVARRGQEDEDRVLEEQGRAITDILAAGGVQELGRIVDVVQAPWRVGIALGSLKGQGEVQEAVLAWADEASTARRTAAEGLFAERFHRDGAEWADAAVGRHPWSPETLGTLLSRLRLQPAVWDLAAAAGHDAEREYWRRASGIVARSDAARAVEKLLEVGRPRAAVDMMWMRLEDDEEHPGVGVELAMRALRAATAPAGEWDTGTRLESYQIGKVVSWLEDHHAPGLADLEWKCRAAFDLYDVELRSLQRELADDPEFFVRLLTFAYHAHGEEKRHLDEDASRAAITAYHVLGDWRIVPGSDGDELDRERLFAWVTRARDLAAAAGRLEVADHHIGQVLRNAPKGSDGEWPHEAVRDLADELHSPDIERGLVAAFINGRGALFVAPDGRDERELAAEYRRMAEKLRAWRSIPNQLVTLARFYDEEGERTAAEAARLRNVS